MRVVFLNRSFWPDQAATGQLLTELCEDLSADHEITVVAGRSSYAPDRHGSVPRRYSVGRVSVVATWGTRLPKTNLLTRLLNLGSYYVLAIPAAMRLARPDVLVAETDPPLLGLLGAFLKRWWGCKLIYYCQDIYPDIAMATGDIKSRFLLGMLERANRAAYAASDRVIVLGRDMERRLLDKGVAPEKIVIIPNWVDAQTVRAPAQNAMRMQFGERFVVMYSGNLGLSQRLEAVLEAADRLRDDHRVLFVMIGEGARKKWLEEEARRKGLSNVWFLPYQPKERLGDSLTAADLHLIPLMPGAAGCMVPSKVYGILAAGRPFVAMMEDFADVACLASENRVGFVTPPGDVDALVGAIRSAMNNPGQLKEMGHRARRLAEERFERRVVTRRFAELLEGVAPFAAAASAH